MAWLIGLESLECPSGSKHGPGFSLESLHLESQVVVNLMWVRELNLSPLERVFPAPAFPFYQVVKLTAGVCSCFSPYV